MANYFENIAGHATVGCLSAVASGGKCGAGALSGAAGSAAAPLVGDLFQHPDTDLGDRLGGSAISGVVGGLASVAGGGKFADGAVTAAFGYLFNSTQGGIRASCDTQCMAQGDASVQSLAVGLASVVFLPFVAAADVLEIGAAAESALAAGNGSGVTVLGNYPSYLELAQQLGANYFSVPAEQWAQMSATEQWTANQGFLDAAITRGDDFVFSTEVASPGSFFERELLYLQQQRVFLGVPGVAISP
jgi:hypothetical protein